MLQIYLLTYRIFSFDHPLKPPHEPLHQKWQPHSSTRPATSYVLPQRTGKPQWTGQNGNTNQSLYTIPAAWVLSIAPHFYAAGLGKFDNRNPRTYTREIDGDQSVDKGNIPRLTVSLYQLY
jgi:hypothetical protein